MTVSGLLPVNIVAVMFIKFSTKLGRSMPRVAFTYGYAAESDAILERLMGSPGIRPS